MWLSGDGFKLVYGYSRGAGNSMSLAVRDLRTKEDPAVDVIRGCYVDYTAVSWVDSRSGFFYSTQLAVQPSDHSTSRESMDGDLATTYSNRVYFHKLGTRQASDLLIFETMTMSDSMMINTHITSDGHYLLLEIFKKRRELTGNSLWRSMVSDNCATSPVGNKVFYYDLCKFDGLYAESLGACVKLIDTFMYRFDYISSVEEDFWFRSNYQATNFRVVRVTLPELNSHEDDPEAEQCRLRLLNAWKNCLDWIPQRTDGDYLASAGIAAHTILVLKYLKDSSHEVLLYDLTQNLEKESQIAVASLPHPPYGTIIGPNCNFYSSEIFYQFTSYADPSSVYRALIERDPFTGAISISFHEVNSTSVPKYDKYMYDTEQVYVETMRNVSVPLLLFGLRETLDEIRAEGGEMRPRPTILFISGGFGISSTAVFSLPLLLFVKQCRGLVLVSNIQGSGIYGSYWCKSGAKENKDNCVADLQGIVKYAIDKGLTTPAQLCLYGGTYNGTIIGAAIARFPSLFSTAVIEDGVFDLIRYPVFNPAYVDGQSLADERFVKDSAWYQEFGCADDSPAELARLTALSPLLQLGVLSPPTSYPAVLLTAGTSFRVASYCADLSLQRYLQRAELTRTAYHPFIRSSSLRSCSGCSGRCRLVRRVHYCSTSHRTLWTLPTPTAPLNGYTWAAQWRKCQRSSRSSFRTLAPSGESPPDFAINVSVIGPSLITDVVAVTAV